MSFQLTVLVVNQERSHLLLWAVALVSFLVLEEVVAALGVEVGSHPTTLSKTSAT